LAKRKVAEGFDGERVTEAGTKVTCEMPVPDAT
jgi:hypothetical protein